MIHEVLPVGPLQCNCSILGDETSREPIVVDPGDDTPRILVLLPKHHLTVKTIVIAHTPSDPRAGSHPPQTSQAALRRTPHRHRLRPRPPRPRPPHIHRFRTLFKPL